MSTAAIVALAIGQHHHAVWLKYCAASWRAYAARHDLDLILLTEPLDPSPAARSPSWQRCLILDQDFARKYARLILLDTDIVINPRAAPNILDQCPPQAIGGVISGSHIPDDLHPVLLQRIRNKTYPYEHQHAHWKQDQNAFYQVFGFPTHDCGIVQGGVLLVSPQHHRDLLHQVYSTPCPATRFYEQIPLSHAILASGAFQPIDTRFNSVFFETMAVYYPNLLDKSLPGFDALARYAVRVQFDDNFFLHFAYDATFMRYLQE